MDRLPIETEPLALYVHWPWCVRKCPYCDFNSYGAPRCIPEAAYVTALTEDLAWAARAAAGRQVSSVFFGGGTPSLMSADGFSRLMDAIRRTVTLTEDCEISMEANPGTVERDRFKAYAAAGVNRISLGIQSFSNENLKRLGRIHSASDAMKAIEAAHEAFENINLDVMYALPGQTEKELETEIAAALAAATTHLSFYELTIEDGTAFGKRPPDGLPEGDAAADMGQLVHERLTTGGFEHYEISGYAKPGRRCRHNRTYWTFGDYLGVGAGAHGKVTADGEIIRTIRTANPTNYLAEAEKGVFESERRVVTDEDLPFEFALNVLRLTEGVAASRWEATTGCPLSSVEPVLADLRKKGLLVPDAGRIAVTELGRRFLSDVQEAFLSE